MTTHLAAEAGDLTVAGSGAPVAPQTEGGPVAAQTEGAVAAQTEGAAQAEGAPLADASHVSGVSADSGEVCPDRRAPGRPRSARADEAIIEATLDLLAEGANIETLSMEAVAARAGVGKATIYRRWPNKEALIVQALAALKGPLPEVTGESLREDLLALLRPMVAARSSRAGRIVPCLIPEVQRNPEMAESYRKLTEPRRELMRSVIRRYMSSGELRGNLDVDATAAMLTGPIISQTMLVNNPAVDLEKLPEQIVDTLLPGITA